MAQDWKGAAQKAAQLDYDPYEAVAMQKLIMKKIQQRLDYISATFLKYGHLGSGKDKIAKFLKDNDFEAAKIFKNKNREAKALRRGLAEMLTTNPDFFGKKGLLNIFQQDLSLLEGDKLFSTLKGWDRSLSGFDSKTGKVGHHTTLSSLNRAIKGTTHKWRVGFNKLAESEGFKIGDEGLSQYAPGVHKAFSTKKGFPNIRLVKGKLAEKLASLMPNATYANGRLEVIKGVNPKLDTFLDKLQSISTHGNWAGGEAGFFVPQTVGKLDPKQAFNIARNTLGAEEAIAAHGRKIDRLLDTYLDNSNFKSLDEAVNSLTKKVNQPNWQPPNVKETLIKEADLAGTGVKSTDILDQPNLLSIDAPDFPDLDSAKPIGKGLSKIKKNPINQLLKVAKNPLTSKAAILGMGGAGVIFSELGAQARAEEAAANPDDKWLQFQLKLDQTSAALDKAALTGTVAAPATGGTSLVPAAIAETGSLITAGTSLTLDAGRSLHKGYTKFKEKGKPSEVYLDAVDSIGTRSTGPHILGQGKKLNPIQELLQNIKNRTGLAAERFDPLAGEFGLSELIYDN